MTEQNVRIICRNLGQTLEVPVGCTLEEVYQQTGLTMDFGPVSAIVNNKVEGVVFALIPAPCFLYYARLPTTSGHNAAS